MDPSISDKIKKMANDQAIYEIIEKIGGDFGLNIDQMGELDAEVRKVMLGLSKSSEFVKNITESLEINKDKAKQIAERTNKDLFQIIKTELQSSTPSDTYSETSSLERAGGFTIEPSYTNGNSSSANAAMIREAQAMTEDDKKQLLSDIENPPPLRETIVPGKAFGAEEIHSEPLVDQLLKGPTVVPEQKIARKVEAPKAVAPSKAEIPKTNVAPPRDLPTNDPYREPVQ